MLKIYSTDKKYNILCLILTKSCKFLHTNKYLRVFHYYKTIFY